MVLKVMTIVGTRPEIIRLSRVIDRLDRHTQHVLVHTGQNYDYELNGVFFSDLGIRKPDHFHGSGGRHARRDHRPDHHGHRPRAASSTSPTRCCCSATPTAASPPSRRSAARCPSSTWRPATAASTSGCRRRSTGASSTTPPDINLTYSEIARDYLLREGLPPDQVIKTGSPMREVIDHYRDGIEASDVLTRLGLAERKYFVVSSHREENVDSPENLKRACSA